MQELVLRYVLKIELPSSVYYYYANFAIVDYWFCELLESIRTGTLCMFAGALGVTTDYLLLGKETNLTEKESRLLAAYKQATDAERETIDFILRKYTP